MRVRNLVRFLSERPAHWRVVTRGWFDMGLAAPEMAAEEIIPGTVMLWTGPVSVHDAELCARHSNPKFAQRFKEMLVLPRERVIVVDWDRADEEACVTVGDFLGWLAGLDPDLRILVPGYGERGLKDVQAAQIRMEGQHAVFIDYDHRPGRRIPRLPRKVEERMAENFVRLLKGTE